jgi:hypothetical protein
MTFINLNERVKVFYAAVSILLLGIGGFVISDNTCSYNVYEDRAGQVDTMMQQLISNPTEGAINSAFTALSLQGDWAYRQYGEQARAYEDYLEACNDVRLSLKNHESKEVLQTKIDIMEEKKNLI